MVAITLMLLAVFVTVVAVITFLAAFSIHDWLTLFQPELQAAQYMCETTQSSRGE